MCTQDSLVNRPLLLDKIVSYHKAQNIGGKILADSYL